VGKKPPQSQKGGSHGLTSRMSTGLSPKEEKKEGKKKLIFLYINYYFIIIFFGSLPGHRWPHGAPPGRLRPQINK
jgi:hypothetical protein